MAYAIVGPNEIIREMDPTIGTVSLVQITQPNKDEYDDDDEPVIKEIKTRKCTEDDRFFEDGDNQDQEEGQDQAQSTESSTLNAFNCFDEEVKIT